MIRTPVTIHHNIDRVLVSADVADESRDLNDICELTAGCLHRRLQVLHDPYRLSLWAEVEAIELGRDVWVAVGAWRPDRAGQE